MLQRFFKKGVLSMWKMGYGNGDCYLVSVWMWTWEGE